MKKSEYFPDKIVSMQIFNGMIYIATEYALWVGPAVDPSSLRKVEIELAEEKPDGSN